MNIWNAKAAEAGREFIRANPLATGVQIDDAAPKLYPERRHFQDAAYAAQAQQVSYRWSVGCRSGHMSGGCAFTVKEAHAAILETKKLYEEQGRQVNHYSIFNRDGVCVLAVDGFIL